MSLYQWCYLPMKYWQNTCFSRKRATCQQTNIQNLPLFKIDRWENSKIMIESWICCVAVHHDVVWIPTKDNIFMSKISGSGHNWPALQQIVHIKINRHHKFLVHIVNWSMKVVSSICKIGQNTEKCLNGSLLLWRFEM